MSGYVKTFEVKDGDNDKNHKLMSFCINDERLLEKYKAIRNTIEDFKNIELNASPFYDDRCIKTRIRTYGDKVYTNFCGLNVPENDIECESFTVISIDSLLSYKSKYYLQVHLNNCVYKIKGQGMIDYLDDKLFEDYLL